MSAATMVGRSRPRGRPRLKNLHLTLRYEDDLKAFRGRWSRAGILALVLLALMLPLTIRSDFWLGVLNLGGIYAIGAIGLNLLTGYTGQVSLGHAFFLGVGAYSALWFGSHQALPLFVWLPVAAVVGGVLGAVIGPFALRLRGNYLAVVSLGLVFLGQHVFKNWRSLTGGPGGTSVSVPLKVGPLHFDRLTFGQTQYTRIQSFCLLTFLVLMVCAVLAKNIARSRPGRAMQAVRDRDIAAEVVGVSLFRTKVGAFVVSSAMAAVAGGLFAASQQFVQPDTWNLLLSIQFIAMIIVGGVGTVFGSVVGAFVIVLVPQVINTYSGSIPLVVKGSSATGFHLTVAQANQLLYGLLIVVFLILEPRGLAALWLRLKAYFKAWPFSY
jgi:branched-chain amino acid transport system permease protein